MTLPISGQNAQPVSVVTDEATIGAPAFPVYGYDSVPTDRGVLAGAALRVKVLSASDLLENGGRYVLQGSPIAVPVYSVPDTYPVQGNVAIAVYPINNWPDPTPPFLPTDIAGLELWLEANIGAGTADGDPVANWQDQSGNGHNATSSGAARPTYKTNIKNGLPILRFDGIDDFLATNNIDLTATNAVSLFIVAYTIDKGTQALAEFSTNVNNVTTGFIFAMVALGQLSVFLRGDVGNSIFASIPAYLDNFFLFEPEYDKGKATNESSVRVNGVIPSGLETSDADNTNNFGNLPLYLGMRDGASLPAQADYAEVLLYNSALSDSNRILVETYLNNKWAIY